MKYPQSTYYATTDLHWFISYTIPEIVWSHYIMAKFERLNSLTLGNMEIIHMCVCQTDAINLYIERLLCIWFQFIATQSHPK